MAKSTLLFHQGKRKNTQEICVTAPVRQKTRCAFSFIIAPLASLIYQENYLKSFAYTSRCMKTAVSILRNITW